MKLNAKPTLISLTVLALLSACGVTEQDVSTGDASAMNGRVVDGYVKSAIVFVDTNENGILDAWEPRANTDSDGYFSYNPKTEKNYCTSSVALDNKYCLHAPVGSDSVLIRTVMGTDTTLSMSFQGSMSTRVDVTGSTVNAVTSPLTSILSYMSDTEKTAYLAAESVTVDVYSSDFLNNYAEPTDKSITYDLTKTAMLAHKLSDVIATYIEDNLQYSEGSTTGNKLFSDHAAFPSDATQFVYQAIAELLSETPQTLSSLWSSDAQGVVDRAITIITSKVTEYNAELADGESQTTLSALATTNMGTNLSVAAAHITTLFDPAKTAIGTTTKEDIQARLRALEVVVKMYRDDSSKLASASADPHVLKIMDLATNATSEANYLTTFSTSQASVKACVKKIIAVADPNAVSDTICDFSSRPDMASQLASEGGTVNVDAETGLITNAVFALSEDSTNTSSDSAQFTLAEDGTLQLDLAMNDPDSEFNVNTTEPLEGTWVQSEDDPYTLYAEVDYLGELQPMVITTSPDGGYDFTFVDQSVEWGASN